MLFATIAEVAGKRCLMKNIGFYILLLLSYYLLISYTVVKLIFAFLVRTRLK